MNREQMLCKVVSILKQKKFSIETFFGSNTCFDIIAKNENITLILKIYENIDSIRREQGEELKKLAQAINATSIIIGKKTKVFELNDNTIYSRYNIQTITTKTFEQILNNQIPEIKYFKGKETVDIDFNELNKKRKELKFSFEELANKIGLATSTLQRFEHNPSTTLKTAKKLEKELNEELVKKIDLLEPKEKRITFDDDPQEKLLEKMQELGLKMAVFNHAPFKAFGKTNQGMLINTGKGKFDIPKKAIELKKTSTIINSDSIIITQEYKYKQASGIPIIEKSDLDTITKIKDLKKLISER